MFHHQEERDKCFLVIQVREDILAQWEKRLDSYYLGKFQFAQDKFQIAQDIAQDRLQFALDKLQFARDRLQYAQDKLQGVLEVYLVALD